MKYLSVGNMKLTGIYKIQSKIKPERIYIGSGINIDKRWYHHLYLLKHGKHHSRKLQRHFNKYDVRDLQFSIITECKKENLLAEEQFYINLYKPYFNISPVAGNQLNFRHSEKSKKKMSKVHKGMKYKKMSDQGRLNMSEAHKGNIPSEETRRKMSKSHSGSKNPLFGKPSWNKGGLLTQEWKDRIGNSNRGKIHSEEAKKRMSDARYRYLESKIN